MADLTRRLFLSRSSVGAVGAIGALSTGPAAIVSAAAALTSTDAGAEAEEEVTALDGPLFMHVRDAVTGEIEVLVDDRSIVLNDTALVAKLQRATK